MTTFDRVCMIGMLVAFLADMVGWWCAVIRQRGRIRELERSVMLWRYASPEAARSRIDEHRRIARGDR